MKRFCKLVAVLLVIVLLFTGCNADALRSWLLDMMGQTMVPFSQMEYTRPDMEDFRNKLNACTDGAKTDTDADALMDKVYALYDAYYLYYTNYKLANIYYYKDLKDTHWAEEYTFCLENSAEVDAGMDQLLYALADSKLKPQLEKDQFFGAGFFDAYAGGQSLWDEAFTKLMEQEMKLQNAYDALSAEAINYPFYTETFYSTVGAEMEQVLVDLIKVRKELARQAGYEDYLQFAYDFYYNRDYTPTQAMGYMEDVREELVALYEDIPSSVLITANKAWTESQMFSYVETTANNMGGIVQQAFATMKDGGYYDITYSPNKYNTSFETFLQYYYVPYVFVNPQGNASDPMTFAHEFGHFCNDYAATGTVCGIDVAEVFSQGMEYLSLFYADGGEALEELKLAGSLSTFVEQSAYAQFEHQLYLLEEPTVENIRALYARTAEDYGFGALSFDPREYISISHLYVAPMYIVSYVLSNDLAMQIYQAEDAAAGAGKKLLEENLTTEELSIIAFVKSAGLQDPFADGRVATLRDTFEKVLG